MSDLELGVSSNCCFLAGTARDAKIVSCYPPHAIVGVINGTRPTTTFTSGGTLTGSAGVNEYKSTYQSQGRGISIAQPTLTTNNTSADPAITQQEKDFLAALHLAASYDVKGNRLDLLRADGGFAATFELAK